MTTSAALGRHQLGTLPSMPSFKVTNVIARYNSASGGPPRTVSSIARAGKGLWDAELFTTNYVESDADPLLIDDFCGHVNLLNHQAQTVRGSMLMVAGLWSSYRTQLVQGIHPDVLHLHGVWSLFLAAFARTARQRGIPYVVAPHGMLEPWPLTQHARRKAVALRTYQGDILRDAAAVHATSEGEADNLRRLKLTRAPIFVIPNGIEEPAQLAAAAPRQGQRKTLLFLSRIHPKKGLDILLTAWGELNPVDWQLIIVGQGESRYLDELKRLCATQHIRNVDFHGHVDGAAREAMFARAAAFVLPTYSENFGNVVGEAMIRGLPVITTTGTPWSVIKENNLGWYVAPTFADLKRALGQLFATDPAALNEMGRRGRTYVQQNLLVGSVRERLLELYRTAMRPVTEAR